MLYIFSIFYNINNQITPEFKPSIQYEKNFCQGFIEEGISVLKIFVIILKIEVKDTLVVLPKLIDVRNFDLFNYEADEN